ncbi:hypothetical protein AVEN_126152-1 [Araneus ventricosus]|uniref:Uncharacterized protein n=1 Tax=Araneus ventricosus TaxID=182803 RepID=A0A4Y2FNM2_ARAVE|nr:hypothetical protein AVEN_126152-1 [Araneus ventricosus]
MLLWDEPQSDDDTELEPLTPNFCIIPTQGCLAPYVIIYCGTGRIHDGSSLECGFEPGTLQPQSTLPLSHRSLAIFYVTPKNKH